MTPGEETELHGCPGRTGCGRADVGLVHSPFLGVQADARKLAQLPLARPHGHGRVALRELDRVEALGDRAFDVLRRDVLAHADEALPSAVIRRQRIDLFEPFPGHGADRLDSRRMFRGHEHAEIGVEFDQPSRLREQGVGGLTTSRGDEEVALDDVVVQEDPSHPARSCLCLDPAQRRLP